MNDNFGPLCEFVFLDLRKEGEVCFINVVSQRSG